ELHSRECATLEGFVSAPPLSTASSRPRSCCVCYAEATFRLFPFRTTPPSSTQRRRRGQLALPAVIFSFICGRQAPQIIRNGIHMETHPLLDRHDDDRCRAA